MIASKITGKNPEIVVFELLKNLQSDNVQLILVQKFILITFKKNMFVDKFRR